MIQKWVRGHQARVHCRRQKEINFKQMRKLRRLLSVAYGKMRNKLVRNLLQALRESGNLHADQNYRLWQKYKNHCALLLQKSWRGYRLRYLRIDEFNESVWQYKRYRLVNALVRGFKTRLLLSPRGYCKTIQQIRQDISKITGQNVGSKAMIIDVNDRITLKNLMKRRRLKVVELIRQFQKLYHTEGIILQLLRARKRQGQPEPSRSYLASYLAEKHAAGGKTQAAYEDDQPDLSDAKHSDTFEQEETSNFRNDQKRDQ